MFRNSVLACGVVLLALSTLHSQVVSPAEIKDTELSALQLQYTDDLTLAGKDILRLKFQYPFYLSRKLDIDLQEQERAEQRSIQFNRYNGETVLAITGNYYAAYSGDKLTPDQRARATFLDVVMPILKAAVPRFQSNSHIQGYAIEVSHHVMGRVMTVSMERPENLMVFIPQGDAIRLVGSQDDNVKQAALLKGQVFLNAQPVTIWFSGEGPQLAANTSARKRASEAGDPPAKASVEMVNGGATEGPSPEPVPAVKAPSPKPAAPPAPPRDTSPQALSSLQAADQPIVDQMVKELDAQAHFVAYAKPTFVAFREGIYLELSINTVLSESAAASRYKLTALAFDDHIAHLVRPVLTYFKGEQNFDGIGFSTTIHASAKSASGSSQAVEFYFPFSALRCYEKYDCTGQQLIDAGTLLVNGERVGLDLQTAEAR
ncbi:MAG: hypothetical protein LAO09_12060 [Acidobacteriia bacterium]|nr:hypothetical protein [Terriglobia bacterium]